MLRSAHSCHSSPHLPGLPGAQVPTVGGGPGQGMSPLGVREPGSEGPPGRSPVRPAGPSLCPQCCRQGSYELGPPAGVTLGPCALTRWDSGSASSPRCGCSSGPRSWGRAQCQPLRWPVHEGQAVLASCGRLLSLSGLRGSWWGGVRSGWSSPTRRGNRRGPWAGLAGRAVPSGTCSSPDGSFLFSRGSELAVLVRPGFPAGLDGVGLGAKPCPRVGLLAPGPPGRAVGAVGADVGCGFPSRAAQEIRRLEEVAAGAPQRPRPPAASTLPLVPSLCPPIAASGATLGHTGVRGSPFLPSAPTGEGPGNEPVDVPVAAEPWGGAGEVCPGEQEGGEGQPLLRKLPRGCWRGRMAEDGRGTPVLGELPASPSQSRGPTGQPAATKLWKEGTSAVTQRGSDGDTAFRLYLPGPDEACPVMADSRRSQPGAGQHR